MFGTKAPVAFVMMMGQSPSSRARIQPIQVKAGHPLPGVRWSHSAEEDYVYIRNEGDGREQLFHESADPDEQVNLAKVEAMRPRLERLRRRLNQMRATPPRAAR